MSLNLINFDVSHEKILSLPENHPPSNFSQCNELEYSNVEERYFQNYNSENAGNCLVNTEAFNYDKVMNIDCFIN